MRWFKKMRPTEVDVIAAFWHWWNGVHAEVATAITTGGVSVYNSRFIEYVKAIHEDLEWELTPGRDSAHVLVVSPAGKPELRALAARWLAAAPPADETWGYVLSPPLFASLPESLCLQITFLSLDWALGETEVEIWIGGIDWTAAELVSPKTPADLSHAVAAIASDGRWILMSGEKPNGTPLMATAAMPLRSARWPRFDLHVPVTLPYQRFNDGQFPVDGSLEALRQFEDELLLAVGGNGTLVAHETSGRVRRLHFYVDSQTNAQAQVEEHLRTWPEGRATADARLDPAFDGVRHLMR